MWSPADKEINNRQKLLIYRWFRFDCIEAINIDGGKNNFTLYTQLFVKIFKYNLLKNICDRAKLYVLTIINFHKLHISTHSNKYMKSTNNLNPSQNTDDV